MTKRIVKQSKPSVRERGRNYSPSEEFLDEVPLAVRVKPLEAKTERQQDYLSALQNFKIVFGLGPSGVGKTYLAVAYAADKLKTGEIKKLLITRPVVEVGEKLGHLPGELENKFAPYLTPVIEILNERLGKSFVELLIKSGKIEATPLAYLRGRTFSDMICILDEAQNTTATQMKMFLTRFGRNCTMIIDGDLNQKDIPQKSGLQDSVEKISYIPSVKVVKFTRDDIVRSGLVEEIIQAYEG